MTIGGVPLPWTEVGLGLTVSRSEDFAAELLCVTGGGA